MLFQLIRLTNWLSRYLIATENLGASSAFRLLLLRRSRSYPDGTAVSVKALKRSIQYRGAPDIGVMSHFYKSGYRILETSQSSVRYIIDAGAHIGDETIRFRHFHPDATIIAIEADADNFRFLSRNVAGDPRIFALQNGLWPYECKLRIRPGATNEAVRVEEVYGDPHPDDIQAISIPKILERFKISEIDILKLDIEGAEYHVFDDTCQSWVGKVKVFIFECPDSDHPGSAFRMFEALAKRNKFNCFVQGENVILIRQDVPWSLETDLFLGQRP